MKIGPNQRILEEIKDQLVQAQRAYREGKEQLIEKSITYTEAGKSRMLAPVFGGLLSMGWLLCVLWEPPIGKTFDAFGFFPVVIVFFTSYFAFFHLTRLVFKPSEDELADDTSYFALFSACEARERRGLFSSGFGLANTIAIALYVVLKQTGLDAWHLF